MTYAGGRVSGISVGRRRFKKKKRSKQDKIGLKLLNDMTKIVNMTKQREVDKRQVDLSMKEDLDDHDLSSKNRDDHDSHDEGFNEESSPPSNLEKITEVENDDKILECTEKTDFTPSIQAVVRGYYRREDIKKKQRAAIVIQKNIRMYLCRELYKDIRNHILYIQRSYRAYRENKRNQNN